MSVEIPNLPFRIRIGVAGPPDLSDSPFVREAIGAALQVIRSGFFDDESRDLIDEAASTTRIVFGIVSGTCEAAGAIVESVIHDLQPEDAGKYGVQQRRSSLHQRAVHRYLVENCDVILCLHTGNPDPALEQLLSYAAEQKRPRIFVDLAKAAGDQQISKEKGSGLNAGAVEGLHIFNSASVPPPGEDYEKLPQDAVAEGVQDIIDEKIDPYFRRAEHLAATHQARYLRAGLIAYVLAPIAVAVVAIAVITHTMIGFLVELVILTTILWLVVRTDRARARRKWIENRFLAERLRAAKFLAACGVEPSHIPYAPFMGLPYEPNYWVDRAFDEIWRQVPPLPPPTIASYDGLREAVRNTWICGQIEYHDGKAAEAKPRNQWLERCGMYAFLGAIIAAVLHVLLPWLPGAHDLLDAGLTMLAITLPALGASLGGIRAHREYSRLAKRSGSMVVSLLRLWSSFDDIEDPEALEIALRDTEQVMLSEAQEWLVMMGAVRLHAV